MNELKIVILDYLSENRTFIDKNKLKKQLNIKGEEQTQSFCDALDALVEEGSLFFDEKKGYRIFSNELGYAYGEIEINKSGNGFVHTNEGYTIFIESSDLEGALHGDKVLVSSIEFGRRDQFKGKIHKVLKRKSGNVVFEVIGNGMSATLVPYNKNEYVNINVNKNQLKNLIDGEYVLVKIGSKKIEEDYIAEIKKVIGHRDDANIDIKLIYEKYDVPTEFSKEALEEAENLPNEVTEKDIEGRVDLRNKNFITIDCDNTKDRDDAVYIEQLENGNYKLYVSISSVNYYVKRDSNLFKEALVRGNSYYPNNTCNPMFPHKLSNGICSLNENVDRLTKTCEMEIDNEGNVVNYNIYNSVINSRKAMKYSEVNKVLNNEYVEGYEPYKEQLELMNKLNDILEKIRIERDCLDFDIPDVEMVQDENGRVKDFVTSGQGKAERIIENQMIMANTTIAEHYCWIYPFIFRVHESPDTETVMDVINLLRLSGINLPKSKNIDERYINSILDKIKNSEEGKVVKSLLLKSMKRAKYEVTNFGHFALQLDAYCHFTSPIRRFTDFIIHTIIDEYNEMVYDREEYIGLEEELVEISKSASMSERKAQEIENEALAMSMAEYMENHIGETFVGTITEVYTHGMFIKTDNMISGKVKFEDMIDDKYHYDYSKKAVIGKSTNKKYQIGNRVYVVVKEANKANRTISFELGKQKSLRKQNS